MKYQIILALCLGLSVVPAQADFTYRQESEITGGAMAGAMKVMGAFSKKAREPIATETVVKGDRMAQITGDQITVTDLAAETITEIDVKRQRYSVYTFDQMRQYLEKMAEKARKESQQSQVELDFRVTVEETGETRVFDSREAKAMVVNLEVEGSGSSGQNPGMMNVVMKTFMADPAPGWNEVAEFQQRLAEKLNWLPNTGLGGMIQAQPGAMQGMSEISEQVSKLKGMPVYQEANLGGTMSGARAQEGASQEQPEEDQSVRGALGRGLGGLGGFGRKKKNKEKTEPAAAEGSAEGSVMEMTIRYSGFSNAPVDPSKVDTAPAGFKKVKSEIEKAIE